jgi:hypothetical protein
MLGPSEHHAGSDRRCEGVSRDDEPCNQPATVHCPDCDLWFCDAHAEDEEWHACVMSEGDVGGEG